MKPSPRQAFTLVELAIAFGVISFALVGILGLLPIGIQSNKITVEQTRAAEILTALEADLRNTHPLLCSGTSLQFGLPIPYEASGTDKLVFNTTLVKNQFTGSYSVKIADTEQPAAAGEFAHYQATVVYTRVASDLPTQSLAPLEAVLMVNWPPITAASVGDFSNPAKVAGCVKTYVTFPSP